MAEALLLDLGGVVLRSGHALMGAVLGADPATAAVAARRGDLGPEPDPLWREVLAGGGVSEREYWRRRAAEVGAALGREWGTADLMRRLYEESGVDVLEPGALRLVADVRAAGIPLGVLTNDLAAFHGPDAADRMPVLRDVDVLLDASVTGVLKPDPLAYRTAAERLGVPPRSIVFLDDMPHNVAGARAVGMTAHRVDLARPDAAFDLARADLGLARRAA